MTRSFNRLFGNDAQSSGGSIPLLSLVPFPYSMGKLINSEGRTFLRSGQIAKTGYDPSLQAIAESNFLFESCYQTLDMTAFSQAMKGIDTDGAGGWMVAGHRQSNAPYLLYTPDDGETWSSINFPWPTTHVVQDVISGKNGVWIVMLSYYSSGTTTYYVYRTTDNGANWTDITAAAILGNVNIKPNFVTNRTGVWFCWQPIEDNTVRRSLDGGATWTTVGIGWSGDQIRQMSFGGGEWFIAGGTVASGGTEDGNYSSCRWSTNNGDSWAARYIYSGLGVNSVAYCAGKWHGLSKHQLMVLSDDLTKWVYKPTSLDKDWVYHIAPGAIETVVPVLQSGYDGSMILKVGNYFARSTDGGDTIVRSNITTVDRIAVSETTACLVDSGNPVIGIAKKVVGLGIPYIPVNKNEEPLSVADERDTTAVMYMCIK